MNKELIEKIIAYNYNEYGAKYGDALVDLKHENEWLHHIIKEVRKYIEENTYIDKKGYLLKEGTEYFINPKVLLKILEGGKNT